MSQPLAPLRRFALVLGLVLLLTGACAPGAAGAEEPDPGEATTTSTTLDDPRTGGNIIPRPDSGTPPQESGDRGGAAQLAIFAATCAAIATIAAIVVRQSRRARRRS